MAAPARPGSGRAGLAHEPGLHEQAFAGPTRAGTRTYAGRAVIGLPDFPWDRLTPLKERAQAHPDGIVDLSVGTPVDPVPAVVRQALAEASDSPGYPLTYGTERLRSAAAGWLRRRHGVALDPANVLPLIGSKELVAWLPTLLGIGPGQTGDPSPSWPTPPTTWEPVSRAPSRTPPTGCSRSGPRRCRWSG